MLQTTTQETLRLTPANAEDRRRRIRELNDDFRMNGLAVMPPEGLKTVTAGIKALGIANVIAIAMKVMAFHRFGVDNDPHGEHDFGSFEHNGETIFWKIDYFNAHDIMQGSPDPADPAVTCRVLTVMLASEY